MKKINFIMLFLLIFPLIVSAEDGIVCNHDKTFDISLCKETCLLECTGITGDKVTFTYKDEDYSKKLELDEDKKTIRILDRNLVFDPSLDEGYISISDGVKKGNIKIKNNAYEPPTKTTSTTTTTADPNTKELTIEFDPNDGTAIIKKNCKITSNSSTCSVTSPEITKDNFNGWGTSKSCKTGNIGSFRVEKDMTYYACYKSEEEATDLFLDSLEVTDKDTNESIKIGTFSKRKKEYSFKVLYDVLNLEINAVSSEGIDITINGNEDLEVGENEVLIELSKGDKKTTYKLLVTRLDEGVSIDSKHYLKSLVIGGYESEFKFKKEVFNYNLKINKDVKKLELTVKPEVETDSYVVKNNDELVNGSKIEILVKGSDDTTTTYTINIIKDESNIILFIIIGLILFLLVLIVAIIIIKSKGKKDKKVGPKKFDNQSDLEVLDL